MWKFQDCLSCNLSKIIYLLYVWNDIVWSKQICMVGRTQILNEWIILCSFHYVVIFIYILVTFFFKDNFTDTLKNLKK